MEISSLQPQVKAAQVQFDKLASNPNVSEKDKIHEACRQFEAVLLRQILAQARKPVITTSKDSNPAIKGIYDDMVNNQLADSISRSGAFGLAKSLDSQLNYQVLRPADAANTAATPLVTKELKAAGNN